MSPIRKEWISPDGVQALPKLDQKAGQDKAQDHCEHCGSIELRRDVASGVIDCVTCGEEQNG